jgi:hypothetical protein
MQYCSTPGPRGETGRGNRDAGPVLAVLVVGIGDGTDTDAVAVPVADGHA